MPLDAERGWELDLQRVARAIRPNTRLISIRIGYGRAGLATGPDAFRAYLSELAL